MNLPKRLYLAALCLPFLALSACQREKQVDWVDGPGFMVEPPSACGVWGAWRMEPSPLTEGRTLVEFVMLTVGPQTQTVQGLRFEVDCATSRYRLLGQAHYGRIGQEGPLEERRIGADLSKFNSELIAGPLVPQVAEACRRHEAGQPTAFASLNEFVEAAGRVGEDYFAGKQCVVVQGPPRIVAPESGG